MNLKLTLSRHQLAALLGIVYLGTIMEADNMGDNLLRVMMQRLYIDLQQRSLLARKQYKLSWHPERAMAFYCVYAGQIEQLSYAPYEQQVLRTIIDGIHQCYPVQEQPVVTHMHHN